MRKSKLQMKIWQATLKRKQERQDNNRRAAWNRVGKRFGLSKQELDQAKRTGLNPYSLLRHASLTADSARAYIQVSSLKHEQFYDSSESALDKTEKDLNEMIDA